MRKRRRPARKKARLMARILPRIIGILKKIPRSVVFVIVIIAATFLVYAPALRNGFVWDDTALVLRDPLVRSWTLIPEGFRHFLFLDATASNFYRPLQRLTFVADYQLYGFSNRGAGILRVSPFMPGRPSRSFSCGKSCAYRAVDWPEKGEGNDRWALAIALSWAIHPLHTSAVTYVSGRADPLAALFGFSALALGLASLEELGRCSPAALVEGSAPSCRPSPSLEDSAPSLPIPRRLRYLREVSASAFRFQGRRACFLAALFPRKAAAWRC